MNRESAKLALIRHDNLAQLKEAYPCPVEFFKEGLYHVLGFIASEVQLDIAREVADDSHPQRMIQAQRSQAKTTIVMFYAVWRLIHNPSTRILIFSAGAKLTAEISNGILQILHSWDILECLRGEAKSGDRTSGLCFDIHHSLKGNDKSPSVSSVSIESTMQGLRADLIIGDDIESYKNSKDATAREKLRNKVRDLTSISTNNEVIYLGTYQSNTSIYKAFPSQGVRVVVYPGRIPTEASQASYEGLLAPYIVQRMKVASTPSYGLTKLHGEPTDPEIHDEESLLTKERAQGLSTFTLQYLLDPSLVSAENHPLSSCDLIVSRRDYVEQYNDNLKYSKSIEESITNKLLRDDALFYSPSDEFDNCSDRKYNEKVMFVDPAGKGGDETAYAVVGRSLGKVHIISIGGTQSGYDESSLQQLTKIALEFRPKRIVVEDNFGAGMFSQHWRRSINENPNVLKVKLDYNFPAIEGHTATTNKEKRIIETLEPLMSNHMISISETALLNDYKTAQSNDPVNFAKYRLITQLNGMVRSKNGLKHDDRIDALASAIAMFDVTAFGLVAKVASRKADAKERKVFFDNVRRYGIRYLGNKPVRSPLRLKSNKVGSSSSLSNSRWD